MYLRYHYRVLVAPQNCMSCVALHHLGAWQVPHHNASVQTECSFLDTFSKYFNSKASFITFAVEIAAMRVTRRDRQRQNGAVTWQLSQSIA